MSEDLHFENSELFSMALKSSGIKTELKRGKEAKEFHQ